MKKVYNLIIMRITNILLLCLIFRVMEMIYFIPFVLGSLFAMALDILWWHKAELQRYEKGIKWHEHYHVGLEAIIIAAFVGTFSAPAAAVFYGFGFLFIVAEWRQVIEVSGRRVVPGHPFAYGSSHFKSSTGFGILLIIVSILVFIYVSN